MILMFAIMTGNFNYHITQLNTRFELRFYTYSYNKTNQMH